MYSGNKLVCVQGLCFAFMTSKGTKTEHAKLLVALSKGIPGLLTRFLPLVSDPIHHKRLLLLAENQIRSESLCQGRQQPTPKNYVKSLNETLLKLALNMATVPVSSLVLAVCSQGGQQDITASKQGHECRAHAVPLPLATCIAHKIHPGIFPSSDSSSIQVCL